MKRKLNPVRRVELLSIVKKPGPVQTPAPQNRAQRRLLKRYLNRQGVGTRGLKQA